MTIHTIYLHGRPWYVAGDTKTWFVENDAGLSYGPFKTFKQATAWVRDIIGSWGPCPDHQVTMVDPAPTVTIFGRNVATKTPKRTLHKRMHDDRIGRISVR